MTGPAAHDPRTPWVAILRVAAFPVLIAAGGCVMHTLDANEFEDLPHRLSRLYYTGTEGEYHYFRGNVFLGADRRYRIPQSAWLITNTFPRTSNRSAWIPWERSLLGTDGLRGEQPHSFER